MLTRSSLFRRHLAAGRHCLAQRRFDDAAREYFAAAYHAATPLKADECRRAGDHAQGLANQARFNGSH